MSCDMCFSDGRYVYLAPRQVLDDVSLRLFYFHRFCFRMDMFMVLISPPSLLAFCVRDHI